MPTKRKPRKRVVRMTGGNWKKIAEAVGKSVLKVAVKTAPSVIKKMMGSGIGIAGRRSGGCYKPAVKRRKPPKRRVKRR